MNLVDLGVLGVLAVSALLGVARGFVRELLGVGAWIAAAYAALLYGPALVPFAERTIGNPDLADPAAYIAVFLGVLIVLSIAANLIGRAVRFSLLGGLDRVLGAVFGLARGAALVVAAYILVSLLLPEGWPPILQHARTLPTVYRGAVWAADFVPPRFRPRVAPPPGVAPEAAPAAPPAETAPPAGQDAEPTHA